MHLSEDQLHDYAGGELAPAEMACVAAHLEVCALCTAQVEPLLALTARLSALPRVAAPVADGWPALRARLLAEEAASAPTAIPVAKVVSLDAHRRRALPAWVPQAAAAALLLGIGFGGGRLSGAPSTAEAALAADTLVTAMQTAVRVQRAGTEYVAAVAQFVAFAGRDTLAAEQGREAAIAACYGATRELTRLRDSDSSAARLFRTASTTRHGPTPPPDSAPRAGVLF